MKTIIVGLGTQGNKRKFFGGKDIIATVDLINPKADYKNIKEIPLDLYEAVVCCTDEASKFKIIEYSLKNKKHVLVEKPLFLSSKLNKYLENLAKKNNLFCYTAYNHRFEPHFIKMKKIIESGYLGKIYSCRLFYGNGTARLVRNSKWRDKNLGVLSDLGSHLIDLCNFWFNDFRKNYKIISINKFENKSADHVVISSEKTKPRIEMEMTLCMWRNSFSCDIIGEKGSAHIDSLCKWGPSTFIKRKRVYPSGKPKENKIILRMSDPTWSKEYKYFKKNIYSKKKTDLSGDLYIYNQLNKLSNNL